MITLFLHISQITLLVYIWQEPAQTEHSPPEAAVSGLRAEPERGRRYLP
jgi:hypothetical protein